tara:strand:- start:2836 stop:4380 length:1545 start_codon:yes stop_codon:yes gene_type:complete
MTDIHEALKPLAVEIDSLTPDPSNARKHDKRNIEAIKASLARFGQTKPIVLHANGSTIIAGNGTWHAAKELGWTHIAAAKTSLDTAEAVAYGIADNKTAELAEWEDDTLRDLMDALPDDLKLATGFEGDEIAQLLRLPEEPEELDEDETPEVPEEATTQVGDLWLLGEHRLLCGDSTKAEDCARLFDGAKATLVHADPPYGMGKEKDGVANDNLYREKLDKFQMEWWRAFRPYIEDNASAYIWGNAADLWRLWYLGGLSDSERLTMRNEITWDKREQNPTMLVSGVPLESRRMYHPTERCLFFMLGEQGFNNNADNYWEGWEPIRAYLDQERKKCGWSIPQTKEIAGHSPKSGCHWFDRSQWSMPTEETYKKWQEAAKQCNAFKREHDDLKREHDDLKREWYETRAYFDNTHDNMTDVWEFSRVTGEDRHGHATPKPVEMVGRAIKSSSQAEDVVAVPFSGTGPEFVAAEKLGRKCYGMELEPKYCDVIVQRWENLTGKKAERVSAEASNDEAA